MANTIGINDLFDIKELTTVDTTIFTAPTTPSSTTHVRRFKILLSCWGAAGGEVTIQKRDAAEITADANIVLPAYVMAQKDTYEFLIGYLNGGCIISAFSSVNSIVNISAVDGVVVT